VRYRAATLEKVVVVVVVVVVIIILLSTYQPYTPAASLAPLAGRQCSTAPDSSASLQYDARLAGGGGRLTLLNDGLKGPTSAKESSVYAVS
jgi:hypothetical protein